MPAADVSEQEYGLRTFRIDEHSTIGMTIEVRRRRTSLLTGIDELRITHVAPGSVAANLGMPTGVAITGVNGRALPPGNANAQMKVITDAVGSSERPLYIAVYVEPPKQPRRTSTLSSVRKSKPDIAVALSDLSKIQSEGDPNSNASTARSRSSASDSELAEPQNEEEAAVSC